MVDIININENNRLKVELVEEVLKFIMIELMECRYSMIQLN